MYKALYRAYRPEVFEQLLGQDHVKKILKNQLKADTISHAYLFCGTRGTGKTTTARLLAKGLNCLSEGDKPCGQCSNCQAISNGTFIDVVEIDAASNRGIDQVKELRESINYPPFTGSKKVYIIDEVHMLTPEAFNALLKTLEEPPHYVVFILATTEPQKLPATILSRCVHLDFRRVPERIIAEGMKNICGELGIEVTESALRIIAANADGSVRDGLSILDQCVTGSRGKVDTAEVLEYLGASGEEAMLELTDMVIRGRTADAIGCISNLLESGREAKQLMNDWIQHYRNLLMARFIRDPQEVINLSVENIDRIREQAQMMEPEEISRGIMELSKTLNEAKWSPKPRILLELCVVNLSNRGDLTKAMPAMKKIEPKTKAEVKKEAESPAAEGPAEDVFTETEAGAVEDEPAPKGEEGHDLLTLWDQVFNDGSASKGSMYLIRSNSMLSSMDESSFTVTVSGDMNRRHLENNRKLIEDLMEGRTGSRRHMKIEMNEGAPEEVSVEEAAAQAASLIGIPVDIE